MMKRLITGPAASALLLFAPLAVHAQDEAPPVCTAEIAAVQSGTIAGIAAEFSTAFGEVSSLDAPEDSGLRLATSEDVEQVEMSAEESGEGPVELSNDPTRTILWIDTRDSNPGTYSVLLHNAEGGTCAGEVTVQAPPGS